MAVGDFTPIADKPTLDQVKALLGETNPTVANLATVMNGLKKISDAQSGGNPGDLISVTSSFQWIKDELVSWTLPSDGTIEVKSDGSYGMAPLKTLTSDTRSSTNSSCCFGVYQYSRSAGTKITTPNTPGVKYAITMLKPGAITGNVGTNVVMYVREWGTGTLIASLTLPNLIESKVSVILEPNKSYAIEATQNEASATFYYCGLDSGATLVNTGIVADFGYYDRYSFSAGGYTQSSYNTISGITFAKIADNLSTNMLSPVYPLNTIKYDIFKVAKDVAGTANISFNIEDESGATLITDVADGGSLAAISPLKRIRVRANFIRTVVTDKCNLVGVIIRSMTADVTKRLGRKSSSASVGVTSWVSALSINGAGVLKYLALGQKGDSYYRYCEVWVDGVKVVDVSYDWNTGSPAFLQTDGNLILDTGATATKFSYLYTCDIPFTKSLEIKARQGQAYPNVPFTVTCKYDIYQ